MKKSEGLPAISSAKDNLGPTLAVLMKERGYRSADLSRETKITKSIISEVLSGSRTAGPKTMAQLLGAFSKPSERRALLVAYVADSLIDVRRHCSQLKVDDLLKAPALGEIVSKSGAAAQSGLPYVEELIEEAAELGESEEHVIQLIRGMLEARISAKKASKSK